MFSSPASWFAAQTGTSSLRGTLSDAKGAVMPGATVTISDPQTGFSRTRQDRRPGRIPVPAVAAVDLRHHSERDRLCSVKRDGSHFWLQCPFYAEFHPCEVQGQAVSVDVIGRERRVNTTDASMGNAFDNQADRRAAV